MRDHSVFTISGPTAVGKGTVVGRLKEQHPEIALSISATTRPARPGEVDGEDYHFVSPEQFDDMVAAGELLEWAQVHGVHRYGTPRAWVEEQVADGRTVVLEIDMNGERQVRRSMPEAQSIFLAPPSWEELRNRLVGRGTEDESERHRRLATARIEMDAAPEFDHVVTNDNLADCTRELASIMGLN